METWNDDFIKLNKAGYSEDEIGAEKQRQADELRTAGYEEKDLNEYFGVKEPDMSLAKSLIEKNLSTYVPEEAHTFADRVAAGFQLSNISQIAKAVQGESIEPSMVVPPDAGLGTKLQADFAHLASDAPSMVIGAGIGAKLGASLGLLGGPFAPITVPLGAVLGAGAGGFGAPTMIRSLLMNFYEKGEIKNPTDFVERMGATMIDTGKSATIGAATSYVGGKVGAAAIKAGVKTLTATTAKLTSEVATMTSVGAALEGELPKAEDFFHAAIMVGVFHSATNPKGVIDFSKNTASKMRKIYEATGTKPEQIIADAAADPVLKQELLSNSTEIPKQYESLIDPQYEATRTSIEEHAMKIDVESKKLLEKPPSDNPPAVQEALDHVNERFGSHAPEKTSLKVQAMEIINDAPSKYVDRYAPVKEVSEGAYNKLRMLNASSGKAWNYIFDGARDFNTGEKVGKSLESITLEVGTPQDNANFKSYLVSKRVVEDLSPRNVDQKIEYDKAKVIVDHFEKQFKDSAKDYYEYNNSLLNYGADAGLFDAKAVEVIKKMNKHHVSMKKIFDPEEIVKGGKGSVKLKTIGDSARQIQDPYLSAAENTSNIIRLAERNRALSQFRDSALEQGLIEKVKTPKKEIIATFEEIQQFARENGVEINADEAGLSLWRAGEIREEPGQFAVYEGGKRQIYKFTDDASGILENSIVTIGENPLIKNPILEAARGVTKIKKMSITLAPIFKMNNLFKDYTTLAVKTGEPATATEVLGAVFSIAKKDGQYIDFLQSGASNAGFINPEMIADRLNNLKALDTTVKSKVWNSISKVKEYNEVFGEISDNTMRLILFNRLRNKGFSREQSAIPSRDVTLDFDKRGQSAALANWTAMSAFSRVAINGIENTSSALKDPKIAANALRLITVPTVLLWAANKTDRRMDDIPNWEKLAFWHIPTHKWVDVNEDNILKYNGLKDLSSQQHLLRDGPNGIPQMDEGVIIRIPKNELFGTLFATLPELALDQVYDRLIEGGHPDEAGKMIDNVLGLVAPNVLPDIAVPFIEKTANKSLFTSNKIIPFGLEQASPEHQYTEYTTEAARAVGAVIGHLPFIGKNGVDDKTIASPMMVENFVRSWSGNNGMYVLQGLSKLIPDAVFKSKEFKAEIEKPASTINDIPEIKRLISRYPQLNSKPINDFQQMYDKYTQQIADFNQAKKEYNYAEAYGIKAQALEKYAAINVMHKAMQQSFTAIKYIKLSNLSPDQKQQMIEASYYQMNDMAKKGVEAARQAAESIKQLNEGK